MKEKIDVIEEVQRLIISFADRFLTPEEKDLCLHIWKKLGRKQKLDITRTRLDIWAAAVVWTFCRANFKYEEGITLDTVCDFFKNKKSTVGNKAGEIVKLLKISYFSPEFSTGKIQEHNPFNSLTLIDDIYQEFAELEGPGETVTSKRMQAEKKLDEGIDFLEAGDERKAGRCFLKSVEIDPTYADGYVHLGNIAWRGGDWQQAGNLYRKAVNFAETEVENIPRGAFWGVLESRPYMRALHGLGLTLWKQGRLKETKDIFKKMLVLNPNDNQGVRYLLGPVYHQMGNLDKAIEWYVRNPDDPHTLYNYGLALIHRNDLDVAARMLLAGIIKNPYIAPLLLNDQLPDSDWWHDSSWAEPQYAGDYVTEYRSWWVKERSALKFLRAVWSHEIVQKTLKDYIVIRKAMTGAATGKERVSLGRSSDDLFSREKIMGLARKIYEEFNEERDRQMDLL